LLQTLGGLPLALTLLGHYLRQQSYNVPPRRIILALEHLNNPQARLQISRPHVQAEAHPSIPSTQPITLQAIIAVSDCFLTSLARQTLRALSIFPPKPDSFSEEAALTVATCTTDTLDELIDVGLLECHGHRYRLHPIIADYARSLLDDQTAHHLTQRLITYTQQHIESPSISLEPSTPNESITCICGQTIQRPPGPGRTRQYCSDRCANRARKQAQRQRQSKQNRTEP